MNFTLDINKWRCGGQFRENSRNTGVKQLGYCPTMLFCKAERHNMCCLGHFALNMGVPVEAIKDLAYPRQLTQKGRRAYHHSPAVLRYVATFPPHIATALAGINDSPTTTLQEKINAIRAVLVKLGHTLQIINGETYNVQ